MVELALVFPMLLVLLLGVADFGRVFAAGITVEAAARNAAEAAAQEYLRVPPGPMEDPAPVGNDAYYDRLHRLAAVTACREAKLLANTAYVAASGGNPESCGPAPVIRVCVHDNVDPYCGRVEFGATVPAKCDRVAGPLDNAMTGGMEQSRYVEVRICYRFTTLINMQNLDLPFGWGVSIGDVYLQKERVFTVGWYPPPPVPSPPPPPPPPPSEPAPSEPATPSPTPSGTPGPTTTATPTPTPACQPPVASFTAVPTSGTRPLTVNFTSTSTSVGCPILTYLWKFGDNTTSNQTNPSHVFTYSGNQGQQKFTVTLTVANAFGNSAPSSAVITVTKP